MHEVRPPFSSAGKSVAEVVNDIHPPQDEGVDAVKDIRHPQDEGRGRRE